METVHEVHVGDARDMTALAEDSVELVVTSPPYPMIEMWDETFAAQDPAIADHLGAGEGEAAYEAMHALLDEVWAEIERVLVPGGIACVNVGDATRTVGENFRVYRNHDRVATAFERLGFDPLPEILWRKPVNSGTKFLGSGMVPPNAYVTLEHEYVLVFRNGPDRRSFEPGADRRYEAAYFWEERNRWFSDVWDDVRGAAQALADSSLRERSAAYPVAIPYRLVNMYSVYGDTVLDPFLGTGTTTIAAMAAGRDSVGYERSPAFAAHLEERVDDVGALAGRLGRARLRAHREFLSDQPDGGESFAHRSDHYDVPVRTAQERRLRLYAVTDVRETETGYRVAHEPVESIDGASD